jgi:hypothetical protein
LSAAVKVFGDESWAEVVEDPLYEVEHGKLNGTTMEGKGVRFVTYGKGGPKSRYTQGT